MDNVNDIETIEDKREQRQQEIMKRLKAATHMDIYNTDSLFDAIEQLLDKNETTPNKSLLLSNYRYCDICKRPMPLSYEESRCPICKDTELFSDIKEFIRANDVNEYQVAEKFDIPVTRVKGWIREGRIQYKKVSTTKITMHCQSCGAPVEFGALCLNCLRKKNTTGTLAVTNNADANADMRHLKF